MQHTLRALRARRATDDQGFTLIELLVVVVIIGILVAIAIPVYMNYREGAANRTAESDIRSAIVSVEQFYTDNNAQYPSTAVTAGGTTTSLTLTAGSASISAQKSAGTVIRYEPLSSGGSAGYLICAENTGGNESYYYASSEGGSVKREDQAAGALATAVGTCVTTLGTP